MKKINRLGEVLQEQGIYNREIAKYLNKSEETISRWINNHRQPSVSDLYDIAEYLKVDIRSLLYPSEWTKKA